MTTKQKFDECYRASRLDKLTNAEMYTIGWWSRQYRTTFFNLSTRSLKSRYEAEERDMDGGYTERILAHKLDRHRHSAGFLARYPECG